jgi:1,4-alpha-glucan branching enzyme
MPTVSLSPGVSMNGRGKLIRSSQRAVGIWSSDVDAARTGDQYKYVIVDEGIELSLAH